MPTDADLRALFHDAAAPVARIDAATVIRRSRRRRLPQQLGAGGVLTLAVAGIGVASFNGLQGLPDSATMADAPVGVSEGAPFTGADSGTSLRETSCHSVPVADARAAEGLEITPAFPETAPTGHEVVGTLTLTNTSSARVLGVAAHPTVTLSREGDRLLYNDLSAAETAVDLDPGESMSLAFSFAAVECDAAGDATGAPLEPGSYALSAVIELRSEAGPTRLAGGPASAITLR